MPWRTALPELERRDRHDERLLRSESRAPLDNSELHHVTELIGTTVSGTFLYVIALINRLLDA